NQDPMNPMDNAELTTQIAQLNTVTGINQLNDSMQSLLSGLQTSQTMAATSLIGRSVLVPGAAVQLVDGQAATMVVDLAQAADSLLLTIRNGSGQVVRTQTLDAQSAGQQSLSWDGKTDAGASAPAGSYQFEVKASSGGQAVTATALTVGQVASVSLTGGSVQLGIPSVGQVALADVRQVR
ncbi:MAG: flagellar hook assembly protein FlgD, partial [Pseudomonadota bacterium]